MAFMYTLKFKELSYSIYLNVNIACPLAFLWQVTNFTGVTKFTGRPVYVPYLYIKSPYH